MRMNNQPYTAINRFFTHIKKPGYLSVSGLCEGDYLTLVGSFLTKVTSTVLKQSEEVHSLALTSRYPLAG